MACVRRLVLNNLFRVRICSGLIKVLSDLTEKQKAVQLRSKSVTTKPGGGWEGGGVIREVRDALLYCGKGCFAWTRLGEYKNDAW